MLLARVLVARLLKTFKPTITRNKVVVGESTRVVVYTTDTNVALNGIKTT